MADEVKVKVKKVLTPEEAAIRKAKMKEYHQKYNKSHQEAIKTYHVEYNKARSEARKADKEAAKTAPAE
jgi:hypothetical protein